MLQAEPYTGPRDTVELADEFLDDCRWRGLAVATLNAYRWALDRMVAEFSELPITPRDLAPCLDDPSLSQHGSGRQPLCAAVRGRPVPGGVEAAGPGECRLQ